MQADPIAVLRDELSRQGLPHDQQPDIEVLQMMLEVEGGSPSDAARAIMEAHSAERRVTTESERASETAATHAPATITPEIPRETPEHGPIQHLLMMLWDQPWFGALWRLGSWPFSLVGTVLLWLLRVARLVRAPESHPGSTSRFAEDPATSAQRWIDTLERDTAGSVSSDAVASNRAPLPPFVACSYSDALRSAKQSTKILVVVLTSQVHGDNHLFRQQVLTNAMLVRMLHSPDFLVWGGDVQTREGFRVAMLLEASTFPFMAFIALQPRRSRSRGTMVPHPAVLSRIEGSPQSVLSAAAICSHIQDVLLPRTQSYLGQLRREQHQRVMERELRAEQDRAYAESSRRDQERILQRRAEEQQRVSEAHSAAISEAQRANQQRRVAEWRMWAQAHLVPREPVANRGTAIRVSIKLPDGRNLQRHFSPTNSLEQLYAYVDTIDSQVDEPPVCAPQDYQHSFPFALVQTYPRRVLPNQESLDMPLENLEGFGPSANLIVEPSRAAGHMDQEESEEDED
ncbi:UBX domain-containing protein 10 [Malassezia caprae]|uniref:UBX domain-containing protein 10 n=1 Tax=Malassezia caprae TaxID=1381934 RepID=A0AAF0E8E7_9BASI|nr:UBX domain-containing protein 10 [Malassezia caprae]